MARRYRETDSAMVREELARYRNMQPCPDCDGTRLRREARNVFLVDEIRRRRAAAHGDLRDQPRSRCARAWRYFQTPAAARRQGRDRRQGGARDRPAPEVPERRRPQLPEPGPQRRDAVGRRGAAHPPGLADRLGPDGRDVRARRAQHRPAPARQRPPDRHPQASARHRQQRDRGRARRGHDPRRRPRDRHGPGRRRARRPRDGAGQLRSRCAANPESLTGQYLSGAKKIAVPQRRTPWLPVVAKPAFNERQEGLALSAEPGRRTARRARGGAPRHRRPTCRRSA